MMQFRTKIYIIILREFLYRVKKPSFLIMTFLGPLLILGLYGAIIWLAVSEEKEVLIVNVIDDSELRIFDDLKRANHNPDIHLFRTDTSLAESRYRLINGEAAYNAILYIPRDVVNNPSGFSLAFVKRPGLSLIRSLEFTCQKLVEHYRLQAFEMDPELYTQVRAPIHIKLFTISDDEKDRRANEAPYLLGYLASLLMYVSVLLYGTQAMRGVMEEKTNRVSEILVASVRPFDLMMGKIIGIGCVGLLQFLIWIVFSGLGIVALALIYLPEFLNDPHYLNQLLEQNSQLAIYEGKDADSLTSLVDFIQTVDLSIMLPTFMFYFLGGYLFYSALFAALGSLVDSDSDAQQFVLPATLPLIFSIAVGMYIIKNPDGPMAILFSMIPFTSPVVMMVRIPFGVHLSEFLISAAILTISFILAVWLGSRIFRTGILLYGKKPRWKDVFHYILKG